MTQQPHGPFQPPPGPPPYMAPPQYSPPKRKHGVIWWGLFIAGGLTLLLIGVAIGSASKNTNAGNTTAAGPAVTQTETQTVTATPAKPTSSVLFAKSGSGNWNSPPFNVTGSVLTVTFSYSGNILSGDSTGDNFIADLVANNGTDHLSIVNEIASSGGKTTTLYPNGTGAYHLEVTATGNWHFKITQSG